MEDNTQKHAGGDNGRGGSGLRPRGITMFLASIIKIG